MAEENQLIILTDAELDELLTVHAQENYKNEKFRALLLSGMMKATELVPDPCKLEFTQSSRELYELLCDNVLIVEEKQKYIIDQFEKLIKPFFPPGAVKNVVGRCKKAVFKCTYPDLYDKITRQEQRVLLSSIISNVTKNPTDSLTAQQWITIQNSVKEYKQQKKELVTYGNGRRGSRGSLSVPIKSFKRIKGQINLSDTDDESLLTPEKAGLKTFTGSPPRKLSLPRFTSPADSLRHQLIEKDNRIRELEEENERLKKNSSFN